MMSRLEELGARLAARADRFEPRGLSLSTGRALMALAQLAVLIFSADTDLFLVAAEPPDGVRCAGITTTSLWCVTQQFGHGLLISRVVAIAVLLVVLSGYRPRYTCVPHWFVAFSMATAMPESDGADRALQLATMLLIPLCLGDDRVWQWTRPREPLPEAWRGPAFAAQNVLRLQLCSIYLSAAVTKLMDPLWRQGSAMLIVAHHPASGFRAPMLELLEPALRSYWTVALVTWLVIAVQVVLVVLLWGGVRARQLALVLGISLHGGIMLLMNLASFGLVMIGVLIAACALPQRAGKVERPEDDHASRPGTPRSEPGIPG